MGVVMTNTAPGPHKARQTIERDVHDLVQNMLDDLGHDYDIKGLRRVVAHDAQESIEILQRTLQICRAFFRRLVSRHGQAPLGHEAKKVAIAGTEVENASVLWKYVIDSRNDTTAAKLRETEFGQPGLPHIVPEPVDQFGGPLQAFRSHVRAFSPLYEAAKPHPTA